MTTQHYAAREMTVPVLDRQSGVPIRVYGVVPKMSLTPGPHLARRAVDRRRHDRHSRATCSACPNADIEGLYADSVVHRTEPFTTPQVEAVNP